MTHNICTQSHDISHQMGRRTRQIDTDLYEVFFIQLSFRVPIILPIFSMGIFIESIGYLCTRYNDYVCTKNKSKKIGLFKISKVAFKSTTNSRILLQIQVRSHPKESFYMFNVSLLKSYSLFSRTIATTFSLTKREAGTAES